MGEGDAPSPAGRAQLRPPATWLLDNLDLVPPGRVLDVASGRGRHALVLAERGWDVHAVDRDPDALAELKARADALQPVSPDVRPGTITTEVVDLEAGPVQLGKRVYSAVLVFNYLHRPLMPAIVDAVAEGGVLIYETFIVDQALRGHPKNPAFLLRHGELLSLVAPLEIVRAREGKFDGSMVASVVARRSASAGRSR